MVEVDADADLILNIQYLAINVNGRWSRRWNHDVWGCVKNVAARRNIKVGNQGPKGSLYRCLIFALSKKCNSY